MSDAACSCLNVLPGRTDHENGTSSDFWYCRDCKTRFVRQPAADYERDTLLADLAKAREALERLTAIFEHEIADPNVWTRPDWLLATLARHTTEGKP